MQVAPNNRIFFIDHNSKKTTWVDPRTGKCHKIVLILNSENSFYDGYIVHSYVNYNTTLFIAIQLTEIKNKTNQNTEMKEAVDIS